MIAGVGIWQQEKWAAQLSAMIAFLTLAVSMDFGLNIFFGGLLDTRTVAAMVLRFTVWLGIAFSQRALLD